ncbi:50S ribosomal protein L21e [Candidatus Woesearchaeota archaeon]|nr:50S ribosomal protein L21e [Candidatus Woesearchaeota archaeon]
MVRRIGTARRKTRQKFKQHFKDKGKVPLSRYFQEFKTGEKVVLKANLAVAKGMYFPRFHGKTGTISGKRGFCYQVAIKDGRKPKLFNVHPIHLKKV